MKASNTADVGHLFPLEKSFFYLHKPSPLLREMVASGKLGVKSGAGFYEYPKKS